MADTAAGLLRRAASRLLDSAGVIDRARFDDVVDLSWPRIATGLALMSQQVADVAMVGTALGAEAVTGLAFAYTYWHLGHQFSLGIAGGTISLVSQAVGADDPGAADRSVKVSAVVALGFSLPLAAAFLFLSPELIALFGTTPAVVDFGGRYLGVLAFAMSFGFLNKVGSRTYAALDDTFTPMLIRAGGAVVNVALNALFIFGLGLGVVGAALGTAVALGLATAAFAWGLVGGRSYGEGDLPLAVTVTGPYFDAGLARRLFRVAAPLMVRRLLRAAFRFPLLVLVSAFGPLVVAALEIGRRLRNLMNSLRWGFLTAASSLVGRHVGAGDRREARATGADVLRLSVVCYVLLAAAVVALAPRLARLFVDDPAAVGQATLFVQVSAVAAVGLGIDGTATGVLRGGGDTRWTFYATLAGMYAVAIPLTYASVATDLGIRALYAALLLETFVPAGVMLYRYSRGHWLAAAGPPDGDAGTAGAGD